jgi:hypothetical protein
MVTVTEKLEGWGCREEERYLRWKEREGNEPVLVLCSMCSMYASAAVYEVM